MDEIRDPGTTQCDDWDDLVLAAPGWDDFLGDDVMWDTSAWDSPGADPSARDGVATEGSIQGGLAPTAYKVLSDEIDDALDELIRLDLRRSQLAAQEMHLLVRVAGVAERRREVVVLEDATDAERLLTLSDEAREEISAALRRSPTTVHGQLVNARLLFGPLRRTLDALAAGRVTEGHARVIAEQGEVLYRSLHADDTAFTRACADLEDRVLVRAESCSRAQLQRLAKAAVAAIDAEGEQVRRRDARGTEDVSIQPDDHGLAILVARMQAADAERIKAAVEGHAASGSLVTPCDATLGQRRVAALLDLVIGTGTGGSVGSGDDSGARGDARPRVGAEISVVMTLDEFVQGSGVVGELLDDPQVPLTVRRLITDPQTGRAIDLGRRRYEVSEPLRRWIIARDRTCRFPGCSRRASACQIDHVEAWGDGGATDASNLQALCTRHHQLKTIGGWRANRENATGRTVWTSPTGRIYRVDAEPVVSPPTASQQTMPPQAMPPPEAMEAEPPPF